MLQGTESLEEIDDLQIHELLLHNVAPDGEKTRLPFFGDVAIILEHFRNGIQRHAKVDELGLDVFEEGHIVGVVVETDDELGSGREVLRNPVLEVALDVFPLFPKQMGIVYDKDESQVSLLSLELVADHCQPGEEADSDLLFLQVDSSLDVEDLSEFD